MHRHHGVQHVFRFRVLGHDAVERFRQILGRRLLRRVLAALQAFGVTWERKTRPAEKVPA